MGDQELLNRITCDPEILAGKPVIKGTRLSVEYILRLLDNGAKPQDIIREYPGLEPEDVIACIKFAL